MHDFSLVRTRFCSPEFVFVCGGCIFSCSLFGRSLLSSFYCLSAFASFLFPHFSPFHSSHFCPSLLLLSFAFSRSLCLVSHFPYALLCSLVTSAKIPKQATRPVREARSRKASGRQVWVVKDFRSREFENVLHSFSTEQK